MNYKTFFYKVKVLMVALLILGAIGAGIYAYAASTTAQAKDVEIEGLKIILNDFQTRADKIEYEKNRGVIETIVDICNEEDIDVDLAVNIAAYESLLDRYFQGVNESGTIDRGVFAFNNFHYAHVSSECAFDVECATRTFCQEIKKGNINKWLSLKALKKLGYDPEILKKYNK